MFAGPLLGGAVMSAFSPSAVLAVNAATFLIATADSPARASGLSPAEQRRSAHGLLSSITSGLPHLEARPVGGA
jgi:hypothetical protein